MKALAIVVVVTACAIPLTLFAVWRVRVAEHARPPIYGVVLDPTTSHFPDKEHACHSLAGIVRSILREASNQPGARLEVLVLGDSSRDGEPIRLPESGELPLRTRLSMSRDILKNNQTEYIQALVADCMKTPSPEFSAISLGVLRMLESLQGQGCGTKAHCLVYVDTDGDENVDVTIHSRLEHGSSSFPRIKSPFRNDDINVRFCGLAEKNLRARSHSERNAPSHVSRSRATPDATSRAWLSVFSQPNHVSFTPYCEQFIN